jgi:phage tail protein X
MATVIASQGDTLDALCWRHYGRTAGVVEAVLDANPGLADLGPVLPHGQSVELPDQAPPVTTQTVVQLWD